MGTLWLWFFSFFFLVGLLCTLGFQAYTISISIFIAGNTGFTTYVLGGPRVCYINPYDSASRINGVVLPEFVVQGVLCIFFLLTRNWLMFVFSVPYLCYNVRLYMQRQHLVDVTEIYNQLRWEKKLRFFKIGYLILLFFLSLYWLISSISEEDE